ncbi:hypothetical protein FOL47_005275 [Perkinsus chesapeaki]|uniref:Uncharacterized protein n=1 Tax=Perkinsus chesapeaki TaxID=330153 RepID=A0A7J6LZD3_PERCH|nr:hypothetical protein FOL47_005275 [Perkinsus chesapeaki]
MAVRLTCILVIYALRAVLSIEGVMGNSTRQTTDGDFHSTDFAFPPGCGSPNKGENNGFCITGEIEQGTSNIRNLIVSLFDIFKDRSVALDDTGKAGILQNFTGHCASSHKQDLLPNWLPPGEVEWSITLCIVSEPQPDSSTGRLGVQANLSGHTHIFYEGRELIRTPISTPYAYIFFDDEFECMVSFTATGGDDYANSYLNLTMTLSTINGSTKDWHILVGLDVHVWWEGCGEINRTITFIDEEIHL